MKSNSNFTRLSNRIGTNSSKWRISEGDSRMISVALADMDFEIPEFIKNIFWEYAELDFMGYSYQPSATLDAIVNWEQKMHEYSFSKEKILLLDSVMSGVANAIQTFTDIGDSVLINDPVYPAFKKIIEQNGREVITNDLIMNNGVYQFNFEEFEDCIVKNNVKIFILCNPHNPIGRVWSSEELYKIGKICLKYNVIVISDEIHQDLVLFGNRHNSFNTIDDSFKQISIILSSPTKTFNFSGFKIAYSVIENELLYKKLHEIMLMNSQPNISNINYRILEVAYCYGASWLKDLRNIIEDNINFAVGYFEKYLPKLRVYRPQATYLLWLDFSNFRLKDEEIIELLVKASVSLSDGAKYGENGKQHMRLNVATPKFILEEVAKRIVEEFSSL